MTVYSQVCLQALTTLKGKLLKEAVKVLPSAIMPNLGQPLILSDILLSLLDYDSDIEMQIYALKSLFILLTKHGLDSPKYYTKLYNLLVV
jgi:U3 small nucleolar RNA-associated protein 19